MLHSELQYFELCTGFHFSKPCLVLAEFITSNRTGAEAEAGFRKLEFWYMFSLQYSLINQYSIVTKL